MKREYIVRFMTSNVMAAYRVLAIDRTEALRMAKRRLNEDAIKREMRGSIIEVDIY